LDMRIDLGEGRAHVKAVGNMRTRPHLGSTRLPCCRKTVSPPRCTELKYIKKASTRLGAHGASCSHVESSCVKVMAGTCAACQHTLRLHSGGHPRETLGNRNKHLARVGVICVVLVASGSGAW
jgi:hypothetical protein